MVAVAGALLLPGCESDREQPRAEQPRIPVVNDLPDDFPLPPERVRPQEGGHPQGGSISPFFRVPQREHRAGAGPFLLDFYRDAMPAHGWSEVEAETDAKWEVQWTKGDRLIRLNYVPEPGGSGSGRTMGLLIELCPPLEASFCQS